MFTMDIATAVAIVGSVGVITGGAASVIRTLYGQPTKELSEKMSIVLSDIAIIKQSFINLVVFVTEDTPEAKALRDKIIEAMMKH